MDLVSRLLRVRQSWKEKKIVDDDKSTKLGNLNITPKKHKCMILRRSYAIANIAALVSDVAESEHEPQVLNDEYKPQSQPQGYATDEDLDLEDVMTSNDYRIVNSQSQRIACSEVRWAFKECYLSN